MDKTEVWVVFDKTIKPDEKGQIPCSIHNTEEEAKNAASRNENLIVYGPVELVHSEGTT